LSLVSRLKFVAFSMMTAFLIPLLMINSANADLPPGGEYGGDIRVAILNPLDLNPTATGSHNKIVHELIYDSLARMSPVTYLPEPWLASSWVIDEPNDRIIFNIRTDAKWADGSSLNPDDIAYNYNNANPRYYATVSGNDVILDFSTTGGGGRFFDEGIYLPIAHKAGDMSTIHNSGPFKVNETTVDHVTIVFNDNHWNGRPYLDSIRYDYYTNISEATCAFIEQNATFIGFQLSSEDIAIERYPCNKKIIDVDNPLPHVFFSQNPGLSVLYMGINTNLSPLDDEAVRLALTKTVDRDGYAGTFGNPIKAYSDIADSFITPYNTYWFNISLPKYRVPRTIIDNRVTKIFDEVNMGLEASNYMDWNYDGWRETPAKQTFTLSLLRIASETPALVDTLEADIKNVGIRINDWKVNTYAEIEQQVQLGNFTLYLNLLESDHTPSFLYDYFYSTSSKNYFNYNSPEMDTLLETIDDSLDAMTRQMYVKEAISWIATDVPAIPILHFRALYVYNKLDFTGWVNQLDGINNFWSFYNLHSIPSGAMDVDVSAYVQNNRLNSGDSTNILVTVTNESGGVRDANVEIIITSGTLSESIGVTDSDGRYTTTYTAPIVDSPTDVMITARITKPGHDEAYGQLSLAVHPAAQRMRLIISLEPNKVNLASNEHVRMSIIVVDELNSTMRLSDANVTIIISPEGAGGQLSIASGLTDSNGEFVTEFWGDVPVNTNFALHITVKYIGYQDYTTSKGIIVTGRGGTPSTPGPDVVIIVAVVVAVSFLAFAYSRRRRERAE